MSSNSKPKPRPKFEKKVCFSWFSNFSFDLFPFSLSFDLYCSRKTLVFDWFLISHPVCFLTKFSWKTFLTLFFADSCFSYEFALAIFSFLLSFLEFSPTFFCLPRITNNGIYRWIRTWKSGFETQIKQKNARKTRFEIWKEALKRILCLLRPFMTIVNFSTQNSDWFRCRRQVFGEGEMGCAGVVQVCRCRGIVGFLVWWRKVEKRERGA